MLRVVDGRGAAGVGAPTADALWIDLCDPTEEERTAVTRAVGLTVPDRAAVAEIETSSRLVDRDGVLTLSTPMVSRDSAGGLVVAPIGFGVDDELTYNINADTSAGAIAGAMKAKRLLFLTDVPGVLDKDGKLISEMNIEQARGLIADGTISGGMIPKVENCIDAINRGVEAATILDGRVPHALLLEIFTEAGIGTMVKRS